MPLFVTVSEQGPAWDPRRPMREQEGWAEHAEFMNALERNGLVVLGGPLHGGRHHRARLVLQAIEEQNVRDRLASDPWMRSGVLRSGELLSWELLLGRLP